MVTLGLQEGASFLLPHIKGDHTQWLMHLVAHSRIMGVVVAIARN